MVRHIKRVQISEHLERADRWDSVDSSHLYLIRIPGDPLFASVPGTRTVDISGLYETSFIFVRGDLFIARINNDAVKI